MIKQIKIEIDQHSWLNAPLTMRHPIPRQLANHPGLYSLDVLRTLLWIGALSIPAGIPRWWLAIHWACVRYLGIVDGSSRLRLHATAKDLDAHQKTVLSDDWGIGIALEWLHQTFGYLYIENGASYLKRLEKQGLAHFCGPTRQRGPRKCPDFVAVEPSGKLHLIECKGTQQGRTALLKQLAGGRGQKQNVRFPDESMLVGQRLVTGVAIAAADSKWKTMLRIEDPPPAESDEGHYIIDTTDSEILLQELEIGSLVRMLTLGGATDLLSYILPDELEEDGDSDLADLAPPRQGFDAGGQSWIGRVDQIRLPMPIRLNWGFARELSIRHGVDRRLLLELNGFPPGDRARLSALLRRRGALARSTESATTDDEGTYAVIRWGDLFISDFTLH